MIARRWIALVLFWALAGVFGGGSARAASSSFDLAELHEMTFLLEWMEYLPDPDNRLDLRAALASPDWRPLTRPRLGYQPHPIWTRLQLTNTSSREETVILYNQRALLAHLGVNVLEGDRLLERRELGFFEREVQREDLFNRFANIVIRLAPGESRIVLARLDTRGIVEADWVGATLADFSRISLRDDLILGLYTGGMLALIALGFLTWSGDRRSLLFAFYVSFFLLSMLAINGFPRIAGLGLPSEFWVASPGIFIFAAVLCWIPFTMRFLDTAGTLPVMHRWLRVLQGVFVLALSSNFIGAWWPAVFRLNVIWVTAGLLLQITVLIVGILALRRGQPMPGCICWAMARFSSRPACLPRSPWAIRSTTCRWP